MSSLPYVKGVQKRIATNKQQRNTHDAHMSGSKLFLTYNQQKEIERQKKEMKLQKRLQEELQIKMQKEKELEKQKTTLPYIKRTYQPQSTSLKYQKGRRTSISGDLQTAEDIQNERLQEQRKEKMEKYDKTLKKDKLDYNGSGYLRKKSLDIIPDIAGATVNTLFQKMFF